MKILISYRVAPRIRGWETGVLVAEAFRELGHDVDEYAKEYQTNMWVHRLADGKHVLANNIYDSVNGSFGPQDVFRNEYDLVLNMECNDPDPQYFGLIRVNTKKRAVWHFDTSYYLDKALDDIARYHPDHVFFANERLVQFGFGNCSRLPYAASPKFIRPISAPKKIDVGLIGSDRPERRTLIDFLSKNGIKAKLISNVFRDDYINALASCRVVINENPTQGAGLLNMRSMEAPAAGAVLLSGDSCVSSILIPGIECMCYTDMADAVEKCRWLLSSPVELLEIAKRGQERIKSDHMYTNRVKEILDVLF